MYKLVANNETRLVPILHNGEFLDGNGMSTRNTIGSGCEGHNGCSIYSGVLDSLVVRLPWAQVVGGSNPSTPTISRILFVLYSLSVSSK